MVVVGQEREEAVASYPGEREKGGRRGRRRWPVTPTKGKEDEKERGREGKRKRVTMSQRARTMREDGEQMKEIKSKRGHRGGQ